MQPRTAGNGAGLGGGWAVVPVDGRGGPAMTMALNDWSELVDPIPERSLPSIPHTSLHLETFFPGHITRTSLSPPSSSPWPTLEPKQRPKGRSHRWHQIIKVLILRSSPKDITNSTSPRLTERINGRHIDLQRTSTTHGCPSISRTSALPSINYRSNLDFDVPPLSEATGLSQGLGLGNLMQSGACSVSAGEQDSQSSIAEQQAVTPDISFSGEAKRRKRPEGWIDRISIPDEFIA